MYRDKVVGTKHIIYQKENEFKYTTDSLILSSFVNKGDRLLDLGCGTGIISLRTVDRFDNIYSVDNNSSVISCLKKSVEENLLETKISILEEDIFNLKNYFDTNFFDNIVMNPPFYDYDNIKFNAISAKHNFELLDSLSIVNYLLKNSGTFTMIYPTFRLAEAIFKINKNSMKVKSIINIHNEFNKPAKSSIIIAKKQANFGNSFIDFFVNYKGKYTKEMLKVYNNEVLV